MIGCNGGREPRARSARRERDVRDIDAATCGAGGFVASGHWPYLSGGTHAEWVQALCRLIDDDPESSDSSGSGQFIRLVAHSDEVAVLDTWKTGGMRGTGSHDVEIRELFIPEERSIPPRPPTGSVPNDLLRHPVWLLPKHLGVLLGPVTAMHAEVLATAHERTALRGPLRDDALTQSALGKTASRIAAGRAPSRRRTRHGERSARPAVSPTQTAPIYSW